MLGPDMRVPELSGLVMRIDHNLAGRLCEPFEHEQQASHRAEGSARDTPRKDHSRQTRGLRRVPPRGTRREFPIRSQQCCKVAGGELSLRLPPPAETGSLAKCARTLGEGKAGPRQGDGSRLRAAVNSRGVLSERRRRFPQVLTDDEGGLRRETHRTAVGGDTS